MDNIALYLSCTDCFDHIYQILHNWCEVLGAKFNIEKTEIIPIGSPNHRVCVTNACKVNPMDQLQFEECIRIAADGNAVRYLGAWIGNNLNKSTPWEPVIDKINKSLTLWKKAHLSMTGRRLIVQSVIGGCTQFLTKMQGMPDNIEVELTKIICDFIWEENSSPRITMDLLQCPKDQGGLDLLNLKAYNEAIELVWLKSYLNFSPTCPEWAVMTDLILTAIA